MNSLDITILVVLIYFLSLIIISYFDNKKHDAQSFIIGNRQVGLIPLISSISASFRDAGGVVLWVGSGFVMGYGLSGFIFGSILGLVLLSFVAPTIRKHSLKHNYITTGEMLKLRIGNKTAKTSSLLTLVTMVGITSSQFFVLGSTFASILGIPTYVAISSTAIVIGIYLYLGGFSTIVKTDILQFVIICLFIIVIFFIPVKTQDLLNFKTIFFDKTTTITLFVWGIITPFCYLDFYQKIFAAKNNKVLKKGLPLAGPFIFIMTISLVFLGMAAKNLIPPNTQMDVVVFALLKDNILPNWITIFLSVSIICMIMSTVDTFSYVFSSTLLEDFKKIDIKKDKQRYIKYSRIAITFMLILSSCIAISINDFVKYLFGIFALFTALGPVLFFASTGKLPKNKNLDTTLSIGLIVATVVFVFLVVTTKLDYLPLNLIPFAISLVFLVLGFFIFKNK